MTDPNEGRGLDPLKRGDIISADGKLCEFIDWSQPDDWPFLADAEGKPKHSHMWVWYPNGALMQVYAGNVRRLGVLDLLAAATSPEFAWYRKWPKRVTVFSLQLMAIPLIIAFELFCFLFCHKGKK